MISKGRLKVSVTDAQEPDTVYRGKLLTSYVRPVFYTYSGDVKREYTA
jgi:hypothetical protein